MITLEPALIARAFRVGARVARVSEDENVARQSIEDLG